MSKKLVLVLTLLLLATFSLLGCFGSNPPPPPPQGLTNLTYGGAEPQGDYVALTINSANSTVTYHNYTTDNADHTYSFHKVTDPTVNKGFNNLYETEAIDETGKFARFVICDGVAIAYAIFNSGGQMIDNPAYAFCRKAVSDMSVYKSTAYNWVKFKIGATEGNFEAGFAGIDSDTDGTFYGAGYNNRDEMAGSLTNGVHSINEGGNLKLTLFTYEPAIVANYNAADTLTMIGTTTNDFILDFGLNQGAGLAIHQASQAAYQSSYSGTYFLFSYENNNTGTSAQVFRPLKLVVSAAATAAGLGHYRVYDFDTGNLIAEDDIENLENYQSGPGSSQVAPQFASISLCNNATSSIVNNAYKCHGTFIGDNNSGSNVLCVMFDPAGKYLCFTIFNREVTGNYSYTFGFGIKDNG